MAQFCETHKTQRRSFEIVAFLRNEYSKDKAEPSFKVLDQEVKKHIKSGAGLPFPVMVDTTAAGPRSTNFAF